MAYESEVSARLRELAERFGGPSKFAEMLGIRRQNLNPYISDPPRSLPGNKLRARIAEVIGEEEEFYVMHGKTFKQAEEFAKADLLERDRRRQILEVVDSHGIQTAAELEVRLRVYEAMKGMISKESPQKSKKKMTPHNRKA